MGFFARLFGICTTKPPQDADCWRFEDGRIVIELARAAELASPGGAIRLEGGGLPRKVLVLRGTDGQLRAFGNTCTHAKRRIDPLPGTDQLRCCSISKTTYDYEGRVVSGPGRGPLDVFPVYEQDGRVTIPL